MGPAADEHGVSGVKVAAVRPNTEPAIGIGVFGTAAADPGLAIEIAFEPSVIWFVASIVGAIARMSSCAGDCLLLSTVACETGEIVVMLMFSLLFASALADPL